ncbi:hypothetical protein C0995_014083 [Termitomyces sp. Mi166|nr:hypothetical protein C0995_014083 [Termitomyces sp. Mi166\
MNIYGQEKAIEDYDLSAVYMRNWDTRDESGTDKGCEWEKDWEDVQRIHKLSVRIITEKSSSGHYSSTSRSHPTCHPKHGHYARKRWSDDHLSSKLCRPQLFRAADSTKDQTYFLAGISEQGLSRALFPLGDLLKSEVREIAKHHHLPTAERKESMGICFVGKKGKFGDFISSYITPNPGLIIDLSTGSKVATHQGLWRYTIGQGARIPGMKQKAFVVRKDIERNTVYIAPGAGHLLDSDNPLLLCGAIRVTHFSFIWADAPPAGLHDPSGYRAHVKLMHRMNSPGTDGVTIKFDNPLSGISPGQVAVVYDTGGEWCLGCGIITDTGRLDVEIPNS